MSEYKVVLEQAVNEGTRNLPSQIYACIYHNCCYSQELRCH